MGFTKNNIRGSTQVQALSIIGCPEARSKENFSSYTTPSHELLCVFNRDKTLSFHHEKLCIFNSNYGLSLNCPHWFCFECLTTSCRNTKGLESLRGGAGLIK